LAEHGICTQLQDHFLPKHTVLRSFFQMTNDDLTRHLVGTHGNGGRLNFVQGCW